MDKISYERRVCESVDDKNLSWDISQKSTEYRIHAIKDYFLHQFFQTLLHHTLFYIIPVYISLPFLYHSSQHSFTIPPYIPSSFLYHSSLYLMPYHPFLCFLTIPHYISSPFLPISLCHSFLYYSSLYSLSIPPCIVLPFIPLPFLIIFPHHSFTIPHYI